jgi:5'-3' exonuclease
VVKRRKSGVSKVSEFMSMVPEPLQNQNALVLDAMNVAFRWKHGKKYDDYGLDYVRTVESLAQSYDCAKVIVTADLYQSRYRKEILPEYKAHRKEKFADQTEEEKERSNAFFEAYERVVEMFEEKFLVLRYKEVEADDIAAYICKEREKFGIEDIWLISSDKDWDLMVNDNVSRFSTVTRKETTVHTWDEFFDFPIEDYISYKVLTGDSGDNIPGIPGVGPKRATELIKTYGTAFDIYDMLPIDSKYKYMQNLNENKEQLMKNYELMDLITFCEDAITEAGHSLSEIDDRVMEYMNAD